ncbi:patatin-like phospholipase family protein [Flavobacterium lindanitolerans]|nr:patatin-like phospholipase family protein [Flavobacterium lindanitolerans]
MYKILSLDGGGSWSLLQLLTLKDRYPDKTGHAILKEFDMVIANSGGSIILAALVEDWPLDKAIALFKDQKIREKNF